MRILADGTALGRVKNIVNDCYKNSDVDFLEAINISLKQIEDLKISNPENISYLEIQTLLIDDPVFKNEVLKTIGNGNDVFSSVNLVLDEFIKPLKESNDIYLRERALDINDIRNRILNNLSCNKNIVLDDKYIIVVDDLHPSFLIENRSNILGVISRCGGTTSHSAILCRNYNIPYVVSDIILNDFDYVIIDKKIIVNPSIEFLSKYKKNEIDNINVVKHDGYGFYANVFDNSDLDVVNQYFDGIGLYRTEFIFMNGYLSIFEQARIYKEALKKINNIIFRTFDIGDDKIISYVNAKTKGCHNYFNNLSLFKAQIEAFKQAKVKYVMFPYIRNKEEFDSLKRMLDFDVSVGMMLETKDALDNIFDFCDVDFISIGTNDLVLELYGVDRLNQSDDFSYLDDLLERLKNVVEFCRKNNIKLSLCGEIAGVEDIAYRLFNIGIVNLSVGVNKINVLNNAYMRLMNK